MNKKDILLLCELRKNARESLTNISKKTGIAISTLFDRLKLQEKELIKKHTALIDFSKLGYTARANISLKVNKEDKKSCLGFLQGHQNINSIYKINNGYDYLVEAVFRNIKDLEEFVEQIEERFNIEKKDVFYIIDELKREEFMADKELASIVL